MLVLPRLGLEPAQSHSEPNLSPAQPNLARLNTWLGLASAWFGSSHAEAKRNAYSHSFFLVVLALLYRYSMYHTIGIYFNELIHCPTRKTRDENQGWLAAVPGLLSPAQPITRSAGISPAEPQPASHGITKSRGFLQIGLE